MKRIQIHSPDDLHRRLLKQAKARKTSLDDLIRQAVERMYFARLDEMALVAYRNGLISLQKLAEISGTNPAKALDLLRERGITPLSALKPQQRPGRMPPSPPAPAREADR